MADPNPDQKYITESYLRRGIEVGHAIPAINAIFIDLLLGPGVVDKGLAAAQWYRQGNVIQGRHDHGHYQQVFLYHIKSRGYRQGGDIQRGPLVGVSDGPVNAGEFTSIHNQTNQQLTHEIDKSVELENSRSSTLSKEVTLDLTAKAEAGYGGVSASLETHLGISVGTEDSTSSSKTTTTSFHDTIPVGPFSDIAIIYSKSRKQYEQSLKIDAISEMAFSVELDYMIQYQELHDHPKSKYLLAGINNGLWSIGNYPDAEKRVAPFNSIQDFCGFTRGYDPRAPQMRGYLNDASDSAKAALEKLEDNEALRLILDGSQTVVADNNADYTVQNIHGLSDGDLQDLYGDENAPVPDEAEVDNLRSEHRFVLAAHLGRIGVRVATQHACGLHEIHWIDKEALLAGPVKVPGGHIRLA